MARYFHDGSDHASPVFAHQDHGHAALIPPALIGGEVGRVIPCAPGSIHISLVGHGFFVCEPGKHVDLPPSVSRETVKALAPQLISEDEWLAKQPKAAVELDMKSDKSAPKGSDKKGSYRCWNGFAPRPR